MNNRQGREMIAVEDVRMTYSINNSPIEVLKGIDLIVPEGEVVAIIGASGVGKSTLLHVLGLLDRPTQGTVRIDEEDCWTMNAVDRARLRNRKIGFVFQFHHLLPEFSACENVMLPLLIGRITKPEAAERAEAILTEMGLAHRFRHKPSELSGGEQQRVALARALVTEPRVLLADEPTGNLDLKTSAVIHQLLLSVSKAKNVTCVLVTHNPELAKLSDKTITMVDGKIFS